MKGRSVSERSKPSSLAISTSDEVEQFLKNALPKKLGRLIFALDATQSRQPSWDQAAHLQSEMFQAVESLGGLEVQLVFYRGFGECKASQWTSTARDLQRMMFNVRCKGGLTQIGKVLANAIKQTEQKPVSALVFIGDAFEEDIDKVCHKAGELGLTGTPALMFHEGKDPVAAQAFKEIARLTGGAYFGFDSMSASNLRDLLSAAAIFAVGGLAALDSVSGNGVTQLRKALPPSG